MSSAQDAAREYRREFIESAKENRTIWGLWSEASGWSAIDSDQDFDTEVILFWSDPEYARKHQQDEWRDHALIAIPLGEFLEDSLPTMIEEGVLIGPNWDEDFVGQEIPSASLAAQLLASSLEEPGEEAEEELED